MEMLYRTTTYNYNGRYSVARWTQQQEAINNNECDAKSDWYQPAGKILFLFFYSKKLNKILLILLQKWNSLHMLENKPLANFLFH